MVELTDAVIDTESVLERVRSPLAGAVCLFLGTVRELTGERRTSWLDYEAYPGMARKIIDELIERARDRWRLVGVCVAHRLGHLELGEIAVAVAVSAPHRVEAFEACQWLMDTIKQEVPIWKRERYADGVEEWVHLGRDGGGASQVERGTGG